MSGVVVLAEARDGALRPVSFELIAAACELSAQGAGPVTVALVDHDAELLAQTLVLAGVQEVLVVPTPEPRFEAHVTTCFPGSILRAIPKSAEETMAPSSVTAVCGSPVTSMRSVGMRAFVRSARSRASERAILLRSDSFAAGMR